MSQTKSAFEKSIEAVADTKPDLPDGLKGIDLSQFEQEIEERQHIIESCPIDIYVSSINRRYSYPYRLNAYTTGRPGVADSSESMMIDSGWSQVGNIDDILDEAVRLGADTIIGEDVTPACDNYGVDKPRDIADQAFDNVESYEGHEWGGDLLLPIHPNTIPSIPGGEETYAYELEELTNYDLGHLEMWDSPHFDGPKTEREREMYLSGRAHYSMTYNLVEAYGGIAVGGLRGLSVDERIDALEMINRKTGNDVHIHALAPGTEPEMLQFLKQNPKVIDSLDMSTPETAPSNNKMPDRTWTQGRYLFPTGKDSTTIRALASLLSIMTLNYMLSPLCDDDAIGRDEGKLTCPDCNYSTHRKSYNVCPKHSIELEPVD